MPFLSALIHTVGDTLLSKSTLWLSFFAAVAVGVVLLEAAFTIPIYQSKYKKRVDVPVLNLEGRNYAQATKGYIKHAAEYYREGRLKYPGQPFQLWTTEGYMLVIPETWVDEMKNLDSKVADNTALLRSVLGEYQWLDLDQPVIIHTVASNLTPKLGLLIDDMMDELRHALDTQLPNSNGQIFILCKAGPSDFKHVANETPTEWKRISVVPFMMKTIALVSGRVFVGAPLNRDPVWIQAGIDYVIDVFKGGERMRTLPYIAGVIAAKLGLIKGISNVHRCQRDAHNLIVPILHARDAARDADPKWQPPNDMIQFIKEAPQSRTTSYAEQAEIQLVVAFSSIQSTSQVTTNVLLDLCAYPQYIEPLRIEIDQVLAAEGGKMSKKALARMHKLDSFVKESQRLHPSQFTTFDRIASSPSGITLKNGFHIPYGTRFAVGTLAVHTDPSRFPDPDTFNGFRFSQLREEAAARGTNVDAARYQFVATNPVDALSFSHGKHACPGRFLAAAQIKMIVATLLLEYDLRFAPEIKHRPESIVFGHNTRPDERTEILFRRRSD